MGVKFTAASSQYLTITTPPFTALPYSYGYWLKVYATAASMNLFAQNVSGNNYGLYISTTTFQMWGGSAQTSVGSVTTGRWYYVIVRMIATNNMRVAILDHTAGSITHAQHTAGSAITPTNWTLGAANKGTPADFLNGNIAQFWVANVDIQAGGLALRDATVRQYAYGGPFGITGMSQSIVNYQSFAGPTQEVVGEHYHGPFGRQRWVNNNAAIVAEDPPFLPHFKGPPSSEAPMIIMF